MNTNTLYRSISFGIVGLTLGNSLLYQIVPYTGKISSYSWTLGITLGLALSCNLFASGLLAILEQSTRGSTWPVLATGSALALIVTSTFLPWTNVAEQNTYRSVFFDHTAQELPRTLGTIESYAASASFLGDGTSLLAFSVPDQTLTDWMQNSAFNWQPGLPNEHPMLTTDFSDYPVPSDTSLFQNPKQLQHALIDRSPTTAEYISNATTVLVNQTRGWVLVVTNES